MNNLSFMLENNTLSEILRQSFSLILLDDFLNNRKEITLNRFKFSLIEKF